LLALVSLPAWEVHDRARATAKVAAPVAPAVRVSTPSRLFGVYVDPWHLDEWSARVGARPNMVAKFEAFARARTINAFLRQVERDKVTRAMVSWEPWKPVRAALGPRKQAHAQRGYSNNDIAAGSQDRYIARFARSLASFRGIVYVRYAHEMNGFWYPWSADAGAYVRAWRQLVRIVRREAHNVRFVWSVNPNLYEARPAWLRNVERYWPGAAWVDAVGATMINFGGTKKYTVARFQPALVILRRTFGKPVFLSETNTERTTSIPWLRDLQRLLRRHRWVQAIAWSQLESRGQAQRKRSVGDLSWNVTSEPAAARVLRAVVSDVTR
jgi:hypothetical protein